MMCMNTAMMGRRQDDEDRAERLRDAIDARAAEMITPGEICDPMDGSNICEALDECSVVEKETLGKVLAAKQFDQAGILIDMVTRKYWSEQAEKKAEKEFKNL